MGKEVTPYEPEDGDSGGGGGDDEAPTPKSKVFLLHPNMVFMTYWDAAMTFLLLFTAVVTPFEVAFLAEDGAFLDDMSENPATGSAAELMKVGEIQRLFIINRLVDLGFMADIFVNFNLAYFDEAASMWIVKKGLIGKRYLTTWFVIDVVSILPFDSLGLVIESDSIQQLKVLRIVRLLRLIKLLRVLRSSRVLARMQANSGWSNASFSLLKFVLVVLSTLHWAACAWNMVAQFNDTYPIEADCVEAGGEFTPANETAGTEYECTADEETWWDVMEYPNEWPGQTRPHTKYYGAMEFSMMAMVMGYGDPSPGNDKERFTALILMLLTGSVYAYTIGAICGVVSERDPATKEYNQTMDHLNQYVRQMHIKKALTHRLRDYFTFCKQNFKEKYYKVVLEEMSPTLQADVAHFTAGPWIAQIRFFNVTADNPSDPDGMLQNENHKFITGLALALCPEAFAPKELIIYVGQRAEKMFVIQRGLVGKEGRVLSAGQFFGEDFILTSARRHYQACVLTYLDVYSLAQDDMEHVLDDGDFPATTRLIRRAVLRMALRKKFLEVAQTVKEKRGLTQEPTATKKEELQAWKNEMRKKAMIWQNQAKKGLLPQRKRRLSVEIVDATGGDKAADDDGDGSGGIARKDIKDMQLLIDKLSDAQSKTATDSEHRLNELELRVNELTDAITMGFGKIEQAVKGSILARRSGGGKPLGGGPPGLPQG